MNPGYKINHFQEQLFNTSTLYSTTDGANIHFTYEIPIILETFDFIYISPIPFYSNQKKFKLEIEPFGTLIQSTTLFTLKDLNNCEQINHDNHKCSNMQMTRKLNSCQTALLLNIVDETKCNINPTETKDSYLTEDMQGTCIKNIYYTRTIYTRYDMRTL